MIVREERVKAEVLKAIYKTIGELITDEDCFYTEDELQELEEKEFIKLEEL